MKLKSTFALLDVQDGRDKLLKKTKTGARIPVVIRGFITGHWGDDDGVSREFSVEVTRVETVEDKK